VKFQIFVILLKSTNQTFYSCQKLCPNLKPLNAFVSS
jgi:hypothetical protein